MVVSFTSYVYAEMSHNARRVYMYTVHCSYVDSEWKAGWKRTVESAQWDQEAILSRSCVHHGPTQVVRSLV